MPETEISWEPRFVAHLASLARREDRGGLAALRKGLAAPPGTEPACYPYVFPFIPPDLAPWKERVAFTIASLFALHPESTDRGNLGTSFRQIESPSESTERRFVALLNAHPDDLPDHLRQAISLLRSNDVRVNWLQLLRDIESWNRDDRIVQRNWAAQYWGSTAPERQV
jgi:CRISPR system Cascade subunit CasB